MIHLNDKCGKTAHDKNVAFSFCISLRSLHDFALDEWNISYNTSDIFVFIYVPLIGLKLVDHSILFMI